jgi:hypothetical protein
MIDGRVHTYLANAFMDEAEALIAALVKKAVPGQARLQLRHTHP